MGDDGWRHIAAAGLCQNARASGDHLTALRAGHIHKGQIAPQLFFRVHRTNLITQIQWIAHPQGLGLGF